MGRCEGNSLSSWVNNASDVAVLAAADRSNQPNRRNLAGRSVITSSPYTSVYLDKLGVTRKEAITIVEKTKEKEPPD